MGSTTTIITITMRIALLAIATLAIATASTSVEDRLPEEEFEFASPSTSMGVSLLQEQMFEEASSKLDFLQGKTSSSVEGARWRHIAGKLKQVSVGLGGHVWGVNRNDDIFYRNGVGGRWKHIAGKLKQISVGSSGRVWGVNRNDDIFYRNGAGGRWK